MDPFHRYFRSKNPGFWLDERYNWLHKTKVVASDMLLSLDDIPQVKNIRYQLIPSWDIVNKRISQSDWTRDETGQPNDKC